MARNATPQGATALEANPLCTVITEIDSISQDVLSEIEAIARLAKNSMRCPLSGIDTDAVYQVFKVIEARAADLQTSSTASSRMLAATGKTPVSPNATALTQQAMPKIFKNLPPTN